MLGISGTTIVPVTADGILLACEIIAGTDGGISGQTLRLGQGRMRMSTGGYRLFPERVQIRRTRARGSNNLQRLVQDTEKTGTDGQEL